jgi:predicted site-specific integrase-resolvase
MLTTEEVAKLLRVAPGTLARWRVSGKGPPFHRRGLGRVVYEPAELRTWAKAERITIWEDEEPTDAAS